MLFPSSACEPWHDFERTRTYQKKGFMLPEELTSDDQTKVRAYLVRLTHYGLLSDVSAYEQLTMQEVADLAEALRAGEPGDPMEIAARLNTRLQKAHAAQK